VLVRGLIVGGVSQSVIHSDNSWTDLKNPKVLKMVLEHNPDEFYQIPSSDIDAMVKSMKINLP
jgi:hypothetical protein